MDILYVLCFLYGLYGLFLEWWLPIYTLGTILNTLQRYIEGK